jgi:hypothetical protein
LAGLLKLPAALEKFTCIYDPHFLQYGMPTSRELAKMLVPQAHSLNSIIIQGLVDRG